MHRVVTTLRLLLLLTSQLKSTVAAFQHVPLACPSTKRSVVPLSASSEYVTLDSYNSMLQSSTDGLSFSSGDPTLLVAVGIGAIALIGLVFLQLPNNLDEEVPKSSPTTTTTQEKPVKIVMDSAGEEIIFQEKTNTNGTGADLLALDETELPDDLAVEAKQAAKDFDSGDRVGLVGSLRRVIGLVQTARTEAKEERVLRKEAESQLTEAAKEMQDLEDAVELGQNKLINANLELGKTKNLLADTQKDLAVTTEELQELQDERKSLRKLGKVAWNLSRERVGKRWRKIRGKEE